MISLLTFIQTGRLGAVGLDSTREEVEMAWGLPPAWDAQSQIEGAAIWKYGSWEIYFQDDLVWMIFTDDMRASLHMGNIPFDGCGMSARMNLEQVEDWLSSHVVEFKQVPFPAFNEGVRLQATSGVTFTLYAENELAIATLCSLAVMRP